VWPVDGRDERRGSSSARTEVADPEMAGLPLTEDPLSCVDKPLGQQTDVENDPAMSNFKRKLSRN
jgi:hypothetical protein